MPAQSQNQDAHEFAELHQGLIADYNPIGCIEAELVRQLAMATHRLIRFDDMEMAARNTTPAGDTQPDAAIDRIMRYRAQAERSFNRVYKELEIRRKARLKAISQNVQNEPKPIATSLRPVSSIALPATAGVPRPTPATEQRSAPESHHRLKN